MFRTIARATLLLAFLGAPAPTAVAVSGSGSAVFSLDRGSPSLPLWGFKPSDLFVDDAFSYGGGPLRLALGGSGLGLPASANVDAISGGRDTGVQLMLAAIGSGNPMHDSKLLYQFSAGRSATDSVSGPVPIPFAGPVIIQHTSEFALQFSGGEQAADLFDNVEAPGIPRLNRLRADESFFDVSFMVPIDNMDALTSVGSLGGDLDADHNGLPDRPLYFSVDPGSGLDPATIYVVPGGGGAPTPYVPGGVLGLVPGDDIDALSIWDLSPFGAWSPGDGVVFSLRAGSPSLPVIVDGVSIGPGGVILSVPGPGIVAALPAEYFSLKSTDELDAIHVVDPRNDFGSGLPDVIVPHEGVELQPWRLDLDSVVGSEQIIVRLNHSDRAPAAGAVKRWDVTASVEDPSVALLCSAVSAQCGVPGGGCCCPCPPIFCNPGAPSVSFASCDLSGAPPSGADLVLGTFRVKPVATGRTRINVAVGVEGMSGPIPAIPMQLEVSVDLSSTGVPGEPDATVLVIERPNPLTPPGHISFTLPGPAFARLELLDPSGRRVRELFSGASAGTQRITWDGRDGRGRSLPPGLYLLRLEAGGRRIVSKVVVAP